jgi:DNA-binding transcriptional ArsR family regulator
VTIRRLTHAGEHLQDAGADEGDLIFRALAEGTRRQLLDRLRQRNGQTLGELCGPLHMVRQLGGRLLLGASPGRRLGHRRRGRHGARRGPAPAAGPDLRRPGGRPARGTVPGDIDTEPYHGIVRLTVTHEKLADDDALEAISAGWPAVCTNLKFLLETGHVPPRAPWEMHAELRAAHLARPDPPSSGS